MEKIIIVHTLLSLMLGVGFIVGGVIFYGIVGSIAKMLVVSLGNIGRGICFFLAAVLFLALIIWEPRVMRGRIDNPMYVIEMLQVLAIYTLCGVAADLV